VQKLDKPGYSVEITVVGEQVHGHIDAAAHPVSDIDGPFQFHIGEVAAAGSQPELFSRQIHRVRTVRQRYLHLLEIARRGDQFGVDGPFHRLRYLVIF